MFTPNTTTTHQSKPRWILPPTPQAAEFSKSGNELIEEVVSSLLEPSTILDDRAYKILIQDALQLRGLPVNKENVERIEGLVAERLEPKVDTHYKHGDIWHDDPEVSWIWDGWIAEGYFHIAHCNAEGR